jgi:hypothetical protein
MISKSFLRELLQCIIANYWIGFELNFPIPSLVASILFLLWNYWAKTQTDRVKTRCLISLLLPIFTLGLMFNPDNFIKDDKILLFSQITLDQS